MLKIPVLAFLVGLGLLPLSTWVLQIRREQQMGAVILRAREGWLRQDAEGLASLFTPEGELIVPGRRWRGRSEIRAGMRAFAADRRAVHIRIERIFYSAERAVVEWHYEDIETASGRPGAADDAIVIDFEGGQIRRWREYFDELPAEQNNRVQK